MDKICPNCGKVFTDLEEYPQWEKTYCSKKCKQAAENKRWYEQHKQERSAQVAAKRKEQREERRKPLTQKMELLGMDWMQRQLALDNPEIDLTHSWREFLPQGTRKEDEKTAMVAFMRGTELAVRMWQLANPQLISDTPRDDEA